MPAAAEGAVGAEQPRTAVQQPPEEVEGGAAVEPAAEEGPDRDEEAVVIRVVHQVPRRVRAAGGYEAFWKVKPIAVALEDNDTEFRCMNCGGAVKLYKRRSEDGPATHIEHKLKSDSEYCSAGMYFLKATDGRLARLSSTPVR